MTRSGLLGIGASATRAHAFEQLAEQHLDSSYGLARAILGNSAEAEDATHDALVQAWRRWDQLRDEALFERWFDQIVVNTCRNRLRSRRTRQVADISAGMEVAGSDVIRGIDDREEIGAVLATLSADHQIVVALRYLRDLSI